MWRQITTFLRRTRNFCSRQVRVFQDVFRFHSFLKKNPSRVFVMFSHNADSSGGASVVLFEYAKYLESLGYTVLVLCSRGGSLLDKDNGSHFFGFEMGKFSNHYITNLKSIKIVGVLGCTMLTYPFIAKLQEWYEKPVVWWIHEEDKLIDKYQTYLPAKDKATLKICCGSSSIKRKIHLVRPFIHTSLMYYGCADMNLDNTKIPVENSTARKDFTISVIGRISKRKNQLELLKAVASLPQDISNHINIQIIRGSAEEDYLEKINKFVRKNPSLRVNIFGPIPSCELQRVYFDSSLIVCPSIDDPLPVVVTNAFMYSVPCVVSSGVGQFKMISNGINGWHYDTGDVQELAGILKSAISRELEDIGKNGRQIFLNNFTLEILHKHVLEQLNN